MGRRGPRKKLAEMDRLEGNPSRRFIEESGIEALGAPFIPEHLSDDARGCIDVILANMPPNIYSALDSFILSAFGTAWAIHKKATLVISDPNFVWIDKSKRGAGVESGWIKVQRQQAALMASLGDRLGLDPKSRAALKMPDTTRRKSKFAGLLGAGPSSHLKN
jgi:phage terminase small subunit